MRVLAASMVWGAAIVSLAGGGSVYAEPLGASPESGPGRMYGGTPDVRSEALARDVRGEPPVEKAADAHLLGPGVRIFAGPRLGGLIPMSKASATYDLGVEVGAQFALDGLLGAVLELRYHRPTYSVSVMDARVPSGTYMARIADPELSIFVGPRVMYEIENLIVPFAAAGVGLHFVRSTVSGTAGNAAFDETTEQSTRLGLGFRAGAGLRIWEGLLALSLDVDVAGLDHQLTGGSNLSFIAASLCYLFAF